MLFNSLEFIFLFLPFTFIVYFYLIHKRLGEASRAFLVFSSLFFYSWWNVLYLPLILSSMLFNYTIGNVLSNSNEDRHQFSRKNIAYFGILANLLLLGYFKYFDFFIDNFNYIFYSNFDLLHLALPLAISFFTFQQIAFLIDSYRLEVKEYDFLSYAVFVTFFPQLIAGPIVHHKEMMPQFSNIRNKVINYKNISKGFYIFSLGLFKKVFIADKFSTWAAAGFDAQTTLNLFEAWTTSLSYTFQLYFDFSGYTDMAIGLALLFNIKLPINFNSPYKSTNIQAFWRKWHITLSRFLQDYIYIPLGGNRKGRFNNYTNLMVTFLIGGIWHGAGWTFIFWGAIHGLALISHRVWGLFDLKIWSWLGWLITFNFVNISWVFFRADNFDIAINVLKAMFSLDYIVLPTALSTKLPSLTQYGVEFGAGATLPMDYYTPLWLFTGFILILCFKNSVEKMEQLKISYKTSFFSSLTFIISILSLNKVTEFLYFNF